MEYMREVLTREGLQVSKKRVKAIVDAMRLQNQSKVRSFLGSAQFCAKVIPGFSTISIPLWDLTCTDKSWKWDTKEEEAFKEIKKLPANAPVMAYFAKDAKDPPWSRRITCWPLSSPRTTARGWYIQASVLCQCGEEVLPIRKGGTSRMVGLSKILPLLVWNGV